MFLVLAFVAAWMLQHTWAGKVADFQTNRDQVRQQIDKAHPNWDAERREKAVHRATRRSAVGWLAYQLRHGWSPMIGDVVDGYRAARIGHGEWAAQRPEEPEDGWWQRTKAAARAGWDRSSDKAKAMVKAMAEAKAERQRNDVHDEAVDAQSDHGADNTPTVEEPDTTKPTPQPEQPQEIPPTPDPTVWPKLHTVPPSTERNPMSETTGYAGALQLADNYNTQLGTSADQLEQYQSDLIASAGLGNDAAVMGTLTTVLELMNNLQAAFAAHRNALTGHEQGAEYAADKGAAAANTTWLAGGA